MDYLAFILFGIGLLLVITGLLLQYGDKPTVAIPERAVPRPPTQPVMPHEPVATVQPPPPHTRQTQPDPAVAVRVAGENPKLFRKDAYLYLDQSGKNRYGGDSGYFNMENVSGIRRFGRGVFSYDGFSFHFEHDSGRQNFPLEALEQIAFYPNCIVLVPREKLPAALLFVDETDSIRQMLETFRTDNGG